MGSIRKVVSPMRDRMVQTAYLKDRLEIRITCSSIKINGDKLETIAFF